MIYRNLCDYFHVNKNCFCYSFLTASVSKALDFLNSRDSIYYVYKICVSIRYNNKARIAMSMNNKSTCHSMHTFYTLIMSIQRVHIFYIRMNLSFTPTLPHSSFEIIADFTVCRCGVLYRVYITVDGYQTLTRIMYCMQLLSLEK